MSVQKQKKATPATAAKASATRPTAAPRELSRDPSRDPSKDEIDQIMSEIEELQQEMAETTSPTAAPAAKKSLKVIQGGGPTGHPVDAAAAEADVDEEESILKEFQASADSEVSLESTLSDLGEEPAAGNSLLDQVETGSEPDLMTGSEIETGAEPMASSAHESFDESFDDPTEAEPIAEETPEADVFEAEAPQFQPQPLPQDDAVAEVMEDPTEIESPFAAAEAELAEEEATQLDLEDEEFEKPVHRRTATSKNSPIASKKESSMSPKHSGNSGKEGTLALTVSGSMTLKITYEVDGQEVVVGFSDNCLKVELSDGTEFKIPVSRGQGGFKKAA